MFLWPVGVVAWPLVIPLPQYKTVYDFLLDSGVATDAARRRAGRPAGLTRAAGARRPRVPAVGTGVG